MSGAATPGAVPEPSDASEPVRQPAATADPLRIAARTSIAARSAYPAWRPRLLQRGTDLVVTQNSIIPARSEQ